MNKLKINDSDFLWKLYKKANATPPKSLCDYFFGAMWGVLASYATASITLQLLCSVIAVSAFWLCQNIFVSATFFMLFLVNSIMLFARYMVLQTEKRQAFVAKMIMTITLVSFIGFLIYTLNTGGISLPSLKETASGILWVLMVSVGIIATNVICILCFIFIKNKCKLPETIKRVFLQVGHMLLAIKNRTCPLIECPLMKSNDDVVVGNLDSK